MVPSGHRNLALIKRHFYFFDELSQRGTVGSGGIILLKHSGTLFRSGSDLKPFLIKFKGFLINKSRFCRFKFEINSKVIATQKINPESLSKGPEWTI